MATVTMMNLLQESQAEPTDSLGSSNTAQASQALIVQTYCLAVNMQPDVPADPQGSDQLNQIISELNQVLASARRASRIFLGGSDGTDGLLSRMIKANENIKSYFLLQNTLPVVLTDTTPPETAEQLLNAVIQQAQLYQAEAVQLTADLGTFRDGLDGDARNFADLTVQLNALISGDGGALDVLNQQLAAIDAQINTDITAIVVGSLAVIGGGIIIAVGVVSDFVTFGATTAVIGAGVAIAGAGVAADVSAGINLSQMLSKKATIMSEQVTLQAEITLASGINSSLNLLGSAASDAALATQQMANAWSAMAADLQNLVDLLQTGQASVGDVRQLFLIAAQGQVAVVIQQTNNIDAQLAGVDVVQTKPGQTVQDVVLQETEKAAA